MTRHIKLLFPLILLLVFTFVPNGIVAADENERLDEEPGYYFYSEPVGEVFYYTKTVLGKEDTEVSKDSDSVTSTYLASLATGEVFVKYIADVSQETATFFSPDGRTALEISEATEIGGAVFTLVSTLDRAVIWQRVFAKEGKQMDPGALPVWDEEQGTIAVLMGEIDLQTASGSRICYEHSYKHLANFYFLGEKDGEILRHLELNVLWPGNFNPVIPLRFGGGKYFMVTADDSSTEERDPSSEQMDLFCVNLVSGDVNRLALPFSVSTFMPRMLSDSNGEKLFFQSSRRMADSFLDSLGNDIIVFDPETGDHSVLLKMTVDGSYTLGGITPDGSTLSAVRCSRQEGKLSYQPVVVDVESGRITNFDRRLGGGSFIRTQISPSGRYLMEYGFYTDIWIHDLETGAAWPYLTEDEGMTIMPLPGIPGRFNFIY